MRVVFVGLGQEQLAISLLSAVLRREGHEVSLAFDPALFDDRYFLDLPRLARTFDRSAQVVDDVVAARPDLVAFSVLTPTYQWSLAVTRAIKARLDVPVVFGGVHPSAVPEVCLENDVVDYVCVGEGERAIVELCEAIDGGRHRPAAPIGNIWWREGDRLVEGPATPFDQDLDALPWFEKELWHPHIRVADNWMTMAARGCPYRCTFCFNNFFAKIPGKGGGKYLRRRSVDHMMGELVDAKARWGIRRVDFEDDIFTTDRAWLKDFLGEYRREVDLPFQCLVHPRYLDDELARWLKDAGCQHVQMGVQSADEDYKRAQLLRMEKEAHLDTSLAALQAVDLDAKLDHIFGLPGEPISAQERARELYAAYPPRRIQTFWLTHLPGIELSKAAVASGDLSPEDYERVKRGETGRFHTRSHASASDAMTYRRYELLFRLLPLLPRPLQQKVRLRHIPKLPAAAAEAAGFSLEVANIVVNRDDEAINYARHYLHQLRRQVPAVWRERRRGLRRPSPLDAADGGRIRTAGAFGSPRIAELPPTPAATAPPGHEAAAPPEPVAVQLGARRPSST